MKKCAVKFSTGSVSGLRLSLCGYFSGIWALDRAEIWGPDLLKRNDINTQLGILKEPKHRAPGTILSFYEMVHA